MRGEQARGRPLLHRLDRWCGTPAVWLAGRLRRRRRRMPRELRRVGLLQLNAIGDTVLCAPLIAALRRRHPRAEIVLAHGRSNAEAAALLPALDRRLALDVARPLQALVRLRRERFDVLIDLGPWPRISALLAAGSGARCVIGFRTPGQQRHWAFDRAVPHSARQHEWRNIARLGEPLGLRVEGPPRLEEQRDAALPALPAAFVVLHPWAGGICHTWKEWPVARWVELGRWLLARGLALVISGGPGDRERAQALLERLRATGADTEQLVALAGRATLATMTRVLVRARALVTVNTGIMHLAAALDVPLVALHGPTRIARWGPVGGRSIALASRTPGCPYLHLGFEYAGRRSDCMEGIPVARVQAALERLLAPQSEDARARAEASSRASARGST